jgi:hypothetical protein
MSDPAPDCLWFDLLLEDNRIVIARDHLDFISLVALAITCQRMLRETWLPRGLRMAHPTRPAMPSYAKLSVHGRTRV